jgi:hypothetical protein
MDVLTQFLHHGPQHGQQLALGASELTHNIQHGQAMAERSAEIHHEGVKVGLCHG